MSQAKVDRYKQEKANRKKTLARNKVKTAIAKVCACVVALAIVCWAGYSIYNYWEANRPVKTFYCTTAALDDYLSSLSE